MYKPQTFKSRVRQKLKYLKEFHPELKPRERLIVAERQTREEGFPSD